MINEEQIIKANQRINQYLFKTPLFFDRSLSQKLDAQIYLKLENQQISGSFKARGAFNRILSLPKSDRKKSFFVAASTGNHAAAFCTALKSLDLKGKVFLPENVSTSKLSFIKSFGIPFELKGRNSLHTEVYCRQVAEENGYELVHPYNDPEIIAGQGTIALELLDQLPDLDVVVVPVGGGGMIAGIASYLKSKKPSIKIVGCQPEKSPEMVRSIELGKIIEEDISQPTLSDGTAGGMEQGSMTFDIGKELVDEWALISEGEIAHEILYQLKYNQMVIEGAAALGLAYVRKNAHRFTNKKIASIICGKRISYATLKKIISNDQDFLS